MISHFLTYQLDRDWHLYGKLSLEKTRIIFDQLVLFRPVYNGGGWGGRESRGLSWAQKARSGIYGVNKSRKWSLKCGKLESGNSRFTKWGNKQEDGACRPSLKLYAHCPIHLSFTHLQYTVDIALKYDVEHLWRFL